MITLQQLTTVAELARQEKLTLSTARQLAADTLMSLNELLDSIALFVGKRFEAGELNFNEADMMMNSLWGVLFQQPTSEIEIPRILHEIFDAFDQGEYYHSGDSRDTDPVEKYTKPLLKEALKYRYIRLTNR